jgi:hypothetical protein
MDIDVLALGDEELRRLEEQTIYESKEYIQYSILSTAFSSVTRNTLLI